jgi:hypothetical protein
LPRFIASAAAHLIAVRRLSHLSSDALAPNRSHGSGELFRPLSRRYPDRPELEHFSHCPFCGALVDMRDLGQDMAHDQEAVELFGQPRRGRRILDDRFRQNGPLH